MSSDAKTTDLAAQRDSLLAALASAPTIRLGETIDEFRSRYSRWWRLIKTPAEDQAREGR
jgi:hypothetical protein